MKELFHLMQQHPQQFCPFTCILYIVCIFLTCANSFPAGAFVLRPTNFVTLSNLRRSVLINFYKFVFITTRSHQSFTAFSLFCCSYGQVKKTARIKADHNALLNQPAKKIRAFYTGIIDAVKNCMRAAVAFYCYSRQ